MSLYKYHRDMCRTRHDKEEITALLAIDVDNAHKRAVRVGFRVVFVVSQCNVVEQRVPLSMIWDAATMSL